VFNSDKELAAVPDTADAPEVSQQKTGFTQTRAETISRKPNGLVRGTKVTPQIASHWLVSASALAKRINHVD